MTILVIPDIHLKDYIFKKAAAIMKDEKIRPDKAVCMMDIADDWDKQYKISLYEAAYKAAIDFQNEFPDTLWIWGNHDLSYKWEQIEKGFSPAAIDLVQEMLQKLEAALPDQSQMAIIHRIDDVLFMHGGLTGRFVRRTIPDYKDADIDEIISRINGFGAEELWSGMSDTPIWYRPYYYGAGESVMFRADQYLQVVGHTPCELHREHNVITCDTFSTVEFGQTFWENEFLLLNTETWGWKGVVYSEETGCTVIEHQA